MTKSPHPASATMEGQLGAPRPLHRFSIPGRQPHSMTRLCLNSALICASFCLMTSADTALAAARVALPHQPLAFEVNQGQTAPEVAYLTRGPGYMLYLTRDDAVLSLNSNAAGTHTGRVLTMHLVGAAPRTRIGGTSTLAGKHNY